MISILLQIADMSYNFSLLFLTLFPVGSALNNRFSVQFAVSFLKSPALMLLSLCAYKHTWGVRFKYALHKNSFKCVNTFASTYADTVNNNICRHIFKLPTAFCIIIGKFVVIIKCKGVRFVRELVNVKAKGAKQP